MLVNGVSKIRPPQESVRGGLRGADQIAPAVGFGLAEAQQLVRTALRVTPDPAMHPPKHCTLIDYDGGAEGTLQALGRSGGFASRVAAETVAGAAGLALLWGAFAADSAWLDRHFLPNYFGPHRLYVMLAWIARVLLGALGAVLTFVASPRLGRYVGRLPARTVAADATRVLLAVVLALITSELVLRVTFRRAAEERPVDEEPLRRPDQRLGWLFVPRRAGHQTIEGRDIVYAFDPSGYRVRSAGETVDPERPSVLFTGESMMVGHGLHFDESIPEQVETLLGIQSVNLAVHGFANDQAYLRLLSEMPRFRQPVAVGSLFTPGLFSPDLHDHPPPP